MGRSFFTPYQRWGGDNCIQKTPLLLQKVISCTSSVLNTCSAMQPAKNTTPSELMRCLHAFLTNENCKKKNKKKSPFLINKEEHKFLQLPCCWSWCLPVPLRFLSMFLEIRAGWIPQNRWNWALAHLQQVLLVKKAEAFGPIAKDGFEIRSHYFMQFQCVWLRYKWFSFPPPVLWGASSLP